MGAGGTQCGDVGEDCACTAPNVCVGGTCQLCGNTTCDVGEDCATCPGDCPCAVGQTCVTGACVGPDMGVADVAEEAAVPPDEGGEADAADAGVETDSAGGCCNVAGGRSPAFPTAALIVGLLGFLLRRRRR
jgi:MYXO-CTERM domain-containing protein